MRKNRRSSKSILINKSLYIDIYLVGYKKEGESIIFVIYADDKINYVGVVDSYEVEDSNCTIDILNSLKIKRIDLLCWTHPDKDHSLGIDKLINLADKNSNIVIPYGLDRVKEQLSEDILSSIDKIENIAIKKQNYSIKEVMQDVFMEDERIYKHLNVDSINYNFKIISLSPHSEINIKRRLSKAEKIKINDYSIAFYIELGACNFLFAGDIEDQALKRINIKDDLPESFEYVKIPHHSSKTSEKIFETIFTEDTQNEIACTTTATVGGTRLPNKDVLKKYMDCSKKVYCTDNSMDFIGSSKASGDKGVVHFRFDILNGGEIVDYNLFGSATKIDDIL
ncbi:MAG: hypothetical protein ACRCXT_17020 [Paraclostridium sp.]